MKAVNLVIWAAGLGLQCVLVCMLIRRRLYRSFPIFTCLIVYYVFRSVLTYILSSFGVAVPQGSWGDLFSALDLFLQILLVIELAIQSRGGQMRGKRPAWGQTAWQLGVEGAIASGIAWLIPEPMRVPLDRGIVFVTVLMTLQLFWGLRSPLRGGVRFIAGGFALYGLVVMGAGAMQSLAIEARNGSEYLAASYAKAVVYLGIVLFWAIGLRTIQQQPRPMVRAAG